MRASRIDANQPSIVSALRKYGASVQHLHTVGQGCPDIVVGWRGKNLLFEIKDGSKPPSQTGLTTAEEAWHSIWLGQVSIVYSIEDALGELV